MGKIGIDIGIDIRQLREVAKLYQIDDLDVKLKHDKTDNHAIFRVQWDALEGSESESTSKEVLSNLKVFPFSKI